MAQPTLALTFQDLQVRVAEYLGVEDLSGAAPAVPADTQDLDLVKRLVNDGYRKFVNAHPWNFLKPLISVTFDPTGAGSQCVSADASRYFMPAGFYGELLTPWTYGSTGPRVLIDTVSEDRIRTMLSGMGATTGDPTVAALRPIANSLIDSSKTRWEAVFWPTPSTVYTVTARGAVFPDKLVNNTDYHVAGYQFDEAVLAAALACAELQRDNVIAQQQKAYEAALEQAKEVDKRTQPTRIGYIGDSSDDRLTMARHPYTGVDTYNGVTV